MPNGLELFESIARSVAQLAYAEPVQAGPSHPFEQRNIIAALPSDVRKLFDNGHYAQATFEAYKYVDKEVARLAASSRTGFELMMAVLSEGNPTVRLTPCLTMSEKDEQKGFQFLFAGSTMAIRNPRGHQYAVNDSPDDCLDHLSLASMLLRRLEAAGFVLTTV
jgi:uncharacterized protein (TIGR02391 family)